MWQIISDLSGGISIRDLKLSSIQIIAPVIMNLMCFFIWRRRGDADIQSSEVILLSLLISFITLITRYFLPSAVVAGVLAAVILFQISSRFTRRTDLWIILGMITVSVGCGSGYVILTGIFLVIFMIPVLFIYQTKN